MIMSSSSIVDFYVEDVRQDWLYYVILRTGHTKLSPLLGHVIILNKDVDLLFPWFPHQTLHPIALTSSLHVQQQSATLVLSLMLALYP